MLPCGHPIEARDFADSCQWCAALERASKAESLAAQLAEAQVALADASREAGRAQGEAEALRDLLSEADASAAAMRGALTALLDDYRDLHDNDTKFELFDLPAQAALASDAGAALLAERDHYKESAQCWVADAMMRELERDDARAALVRAEGRVRALEEDRDAANERLDRLIASLQRQGNEPPPAAAADGERERWLTLAVEAATGASRDYGGGYRDGAEREAFLHGMQTIVNVLSALRDRPDFQTATCVAIGRAALEGPPAEDDKDAGLVAYLRGAIRREMGDAAPPAAEPPPSEPADADLRERVRRALEMPARPGFDHRIPAIKAVRETTGLGLAEAKRFVDQCIAEDEEKAAEGAAYQGAGDDCDDADHLRLLAEGMTGCRRCGRVVRWALPAKGGAR